MVTLSFREPLGSSTPELSYELSQAAFNQVLPELYASLDSFHSVHIQTDECSYNLKSHQH